MGKVIDINQRIPMDVPEPLRLAPGWVCWRKERRPGEKKPRKIPYYVDGSVRQGTQGSDPDRARLATFEEACAAASIGGYDGIGLAMLPDWGITALDFDRCFDKDGRLDSELLMIAGSTYSEVSPSGTGLRAFVIGSLGNHKDVSDRSTFGVEVFNTTGFVTITGNVTDACEIIGYDDQIREPSKELLDLLDQRFGPRKIKATNDAVDFMSDFSPKVGKNVSEIEELLSYLDADMGRDDWIKVGMALHHETDGDDTGFELWDEWSERGYTYPGTEELRKQWESFRGPQPGKRLVTMASVIKMAQKAGYVAASDHNSTPARNTNEALTTHFLGSDRFQIISATELANRPEVDWLIKGVVPQESLSMIYGKSGTGKSFVTLDLAAHIALGKDWHGRKTKQGRVVYIAAEGAGGLSKRLKALALAMHVDIEMLDIDCIIEPPNFLENGDVDAVIERLKAHGPISLVVTDTLAQVTPGSNENASDGMGVAIKNAQRIIREVNTALLLVHHAGKDENRGARGWSGLRAAVDAELEVKSRGEFKELRVTKMKDGEDGEVFAFHLEQHRV